MYQNEFEIELGDNNIQNEYRTIEFKRKESR